MKGIVALIVALAILPAGRAAAQQACPTLTVSTSNDVVNGNTSSPCALIASPGADGISLREALLAANNASGPGTVTITFAPQLAGATIALTERFAPITRSQIALTGPTSNGKPNLTLDATNASNPGAIFFVAASDFTMSGLTITALQSGFNAMQIGGSGYGLMGQPVAAPAQVCCFAITGNAFSNGTSANTFAIFTATTTGITNNATISDVTIGNNTFDNLFEGINVQTGGSNNIIKDLYIYGNTFTQMTAFAGIELGDVGTGNQVANVQIWQNAISNSVQSVTLDTSGSGGTIENVLVTRNFFTANNSDVRVQSGVAGNSSGNVVAHIEISNNLIDSTAADIGIAIGANFAGSSGNTVNNVAVVNDTITGPGGASVGIGPATGVSGVTIVNTILNGSDGLANITPSMVSYSISCAGGFAGVNHNICADPQFVSPASDFHLQPGSPARGAGTSSGAPAVDLDCQSRGAPPSIGAYEFDGPDVCTTSGNFRLARSHDFNGDGTSDLLWRDSSGNTAVWLMNGSQVASSGGLGTVPTLWSVIGQRDFDGDGNADLLWRDSSGNVALWLMSAATVSSDAGLGNVPTNWTVAGTGDLDGDGLGDILWRDNAGDLAIWFMNGAAVTSSIGLGNVPTSWTVVGDDSRGDIFWHDTAGNYAVWRVNGSQVLTTAGLGNVPLATWGIAGLGDFNGDGNIDILWRDTAGDTAIWFLNSSLGVQSTAGLGNIATTWTVAQTGDYNGDGYCDILWIDASGDVAAWFMNGGTVSSSASLGNVGTSWSVQSHNAE